MKLIRSTAILALLVVVVLFWGALNHADAQGLTKIRVSDTPTTHHLNLYVAKEKGLFTKSGIDVQIQQAADPSAARDAVITKAADVYFACPSVNIAAIAGGAPLKIIAQVKKPCTSVLAVPKNSPIKEFKDLNGKTIAGLSPTCCAVVFINQKVRQAKASFNLVKLAGGPAIAALDAKQVDGAILEEPHASIAELKGYKTLFRGDMKETTCRTINVHKDFLANNVDALKKFIQAVDEANALILKNPVADDIVAIAVKYTGAPENAIRNGNHRLGFTTKLTVEAHNGLALALIEQGAIKTNPLPGAYAQEFKGITW
ncbi:MAG: alkanesulfonate transporter substrate-binding subunit [Syntrophorhabdaceae bacterium PtaU1.Bin034]|nr:MAG: alkanesulfonate transporter substrate-binding subunit [Syntrophorhabdaceae bacterium PtaU1.Bin034]